MRLTDNLKHWFDMRICSSRETENWDYWTDHRRCSDQCSLTEGEGLALILPCSLPPSYFTVQSVPNLSPDPLRFGKIEKNIDSLPSAQCSITSTADCINCKGSRVKLSCWCSFTALLPYRFVLVCFWFEMITCNPITISKFHFSSKFQDHVRDCHMLF